MKNDTTEHETAKQLFFGRHPKLQNMPAGNTTFYETSFVKIALHYIVFILYYIYFILYYIVLHFIYLYRSWILFCQIKNICDRFVEQLWWTKIYFRRRLFSSAVD